MKNKLGTKFYHWRFITFSFLHSIFLNHSKEQEKYNNDLKQVRIVVENFFMHLKKFKILGGKFRELGTLEAILEKHDKVFRVCSYLLDQFLFQGNGFKFF